jgi:hypothetical protein
MAERVASLMMCLVRLQVVFAVVSFGSLVLTVNVVLLVRQIPLTMQRGF